MVISNGDVVVVVVTTVVVVRTSVHVAGVGELGKGVRWAHER